MSKSSSYVYKNGLVSIIVPIYNSEKYIDRCLNFIVNQTYKNIEIILIDDCSTDNTLDKIKEYKDKRILLLKNKVNKGQSFSRNLGITKSSGEFIGFIDSDDFIDLRFYEKLIASIKQTESDIAVAQTQYISPKKQYLIRNNPIITRLFSEKIKILKHGGAWDKLYRSSLLKKYKINFCDGRIWEDNLFVIQAMYYSDKICVIDDVCYNYIYNDNSTTVSLEKAVKRKEDSLFIANEIMTFAKDKKVIDSELNLIKTFILKNFISSIFIADKQYYQKLRDIIGNNPVLRKIRFKMIRKWFLSFSLRKKYLVFLGFNLLGEVK